MAIDPVCGMNVDPSTAKNKFELNNVTYYFCNPKCEIKFKANPQKFLSPAKVEISNKIYTCPMHPEVQHIGPGVCPFCGMALEPQEVSSAEESNHELVDFVFRLKISACLAFPLFVLSMLNMNLEFLFQKF